MLLDFQSLVLRGPAADVTRFRDAPAKCCIMIGRKVGFESHDEAYLFFVSHSGNGVSLKAQCLKSNISVSTMTPKAR
jgi:hypothetical protein